jgi:hypothetical protein
MGCVLGYVGGFAAFMPRNATDEEAAAERTCNEYENLLANEEVCNEKNSCQECIATEFDKGGGFCLWFEDFGGMCVSQPHDHSQVSVLECGSAEEDITSSTDDISSSKGSACLFRGLLVYLL